MQKRGHIEHKKLQKEEKIGKVPATDEVVLNLWNKQNEEMVGRERERGRASASGGDLIQTVFEGSISKFKKLNHEDGHFFFSNILFFSLCLLIFIYLFVSKERTKETCTSAKAKRPASFSKF